MRCARLCPRARHTGFGDQAWNCKHIHSGKALPCRWATPRRLGHAPRHIAAFCWLAALPAAAAPLLALADARSAHGWCGSHRELAGGVCWCSPSPRVFTAPVARRPQTWKRRACTARPAAEPRSGESAWVVLGLSRGAGVEEIKKRYRKIVAAEHPDKRPGDAGAAVRFRQVTEAYQKLMAAAAKDRFGVEELVATADRLDNEASDDYTDLFEDWEVVIPGQQATSAEGSSRSSPDDFTIESQEADGFSKPPVRRAADGSSGVRPSRKKSTFRPLEERRGRKRAVRTPQRRGGLPPQLGPLVVLMVFGVAALLFTLGTLYGPKPERQKPVSAALLYRRCVPPLCPAAGSAGPL
mmetsp:Transcript_55166/g.176804  ORF Transcript_55166/g.176804 Transcript_55166/m.176804 type:complete len:353 (-) Transcript_55166:90-1148(-)